MAGNDVGNGLMSCGGMLILLPVLLVALACFFGLVVGLIQAVF